MSNPLLQLLRSPQVEYIMEAHDALSARVAARAGFRALWASSLSISTAHGVPDTNILSVSDVLHVAEHMADSTSLPILLDGDSGHGGPEQLARFMKRSARRGIAGVCIEDQRFPKRNSLLDRHGHELETVENFVAKIHAAKSAAPELVLIARVEALIAEQSMEEAWRRADAYWEAGADAILIHSNKRTADEVLGFKRRWTKGPVVVVPSTYGDTEPEIFSAAGMSAVIWANHMLRASIAGMQKVAAEMARSQRLPQRRGDLAELKDVLAMNHP